MNDPIVLTKILVGDEYGAQYVDLAVGKTITSIALVDDVLNIKFEDGYVLHLSDEGQSCCERRYMTTDDAPSEFVGAALVSVTILDSPNIEQVPDEDGYTSSDEHEIQFLRITTTRGDLTFATHNEHNGYYSGFNLTATGEYKTETP